MRLSIQEQEVLERFSRFVSPKYGVIQKALQLSLHPDNAPIFIDIFRKADFTRIGGGKMKGYGAGYTAAQSLICGLGESIERYCADFIPPGQILKNLNYTELSKTKKNILSPDKASPFAEFQYELPAFKFLKYTESVKTDWVLGENLCTGEEAWIPLGLTVSKYRPQDFNELTTNGNACGSTREQALLGGLLELIERDAFLFHWWTKTPLKKVDFRSSRNPKIKEMIEYWGPYLDDIEVFSAETDIGLPVFVSIFRGDPKKGLPALTLAASCQLDPVEMIKKSVLEVFLCLNFSRNRIHLWKDKDFSEQFDSSILSFAQTSDFYASGRRSEVAEFLCDSNETLVLDEIPNLSQNCFSKNLKTLIGILSSRGYEALAVDIATRDVRSAGFYVYRTFIPGLILLNARHVYRSWGGDRILSLKQKLGLTSSKLQIADLNQYPQPFP